ncbi:MAG: helix-turn-helix domain-containing protein [SAR202 cluster bacterium]|nr:helix-turn-helix domain-containing protein [SAR202 cluster bacterium]
MPAIEPLLRAARANAGITQDALAAAAGISRQAYAAIEHADAVPSTEVALRLARALGATVESLFRLREEPRPAVEALLAGPPLEPDAAGPTRAQVHRVGDRWVARPLRASKGHPALQHTLPAANGLISGGAGGTVRVDLLDDGTPAKSLVAVGCDPSTAIVAAHLARREVDLAWHEAGSRAALEQLAAGYAHVAGCHLADAATGAYNRPWVERLLPFPAVIVAYATWEQGLLVAPGNPKRIRGVEDLARPGVFIVNREPGSGSRALLDEALARIGVAPAAIAGYDREATSHLTVAEVVGMGLADAGIGVRAAANAAGLDFVPLRQERYDLVIPRHFIDLPPVQAMLDTLRRPGLRRQVEALGGYDLSSVGQEAA